MRRVVITGWGIVSPIGNDRITVAAALRQSRSGIAFVPEYAELGLSSQVAGIPDLTGLEPISRKQDRFMGDAARYAYHAMQMAIDDAQLSQAQIQHEATGLIIGSGVGSPYEHVLASQVLKERGARKIPPYVVPRVMGNTVSANLASIHGIKGTSYGLTSACATGTHCIGHAAELIAMGKLECAFAGASEEVAWTSTCMFDAMGALSSGYNDRPQEASRPFDHARDGFVIAGGAGVVVLESLESALNRKATIHAEIVGYGACSGGEGMVALQCAGAERAMRLALRNVSGPIDYINAHATSTPQGDAVEAEAIENVFGQAVPPVSSTKGLTGHAIAAAGAHELIYSMIMMQSDFVASCHNLSEADDAYAHLPWVRQVSPARLERVMSNSFGFGGTNASLVIQRVV